ncbi:MAG: GatB/YqeY domain-containing protein [Planctomycetota bacterium]
MTISEKVTEDMKAALKAREADKVSVLRMLLAELKNEGIEIGKRDKLDQEDETRVLRRAIKRRHEAAEQYDLGHRPELAAKERNEATILESYLPAGMGEDTVRKILQETIREVGGAGPTDIGKVMKSAMAKLKGQADGALVKKLATELLARQ